MPVVRYAVCLMVTVLRMTQVIGVTLCTMSVVTVVALGSVGGGVTGAAFLVSQLTGGLPYFFWLAPCVAVTLATCMVCERGRLLAQAPVSCRKQMLAGMACCAALSLLSTLLMMVPGMLVTMTVAGLGDPLMPAVYYRDGQAVASSACEVTFRAMTLLSLSGSLVCLTGIGVGRLARSWLPAAYLVLLVVLSPLVLETRALSQALSGVLAYLPMAYFDIGPISGKLSYGLAEVPAHGGLTFERGCAVLLAACAVVAMAALGMARGSWDSGRMTGVADCGAHAIVADNVELGFRGGRRTVTEASLALLPGEACRLVAPNGSGKTTLLRALACDLPPRCRGRASAHGVPISRNEPYRGRVMYVGGPDMLYPWLSVRTHVRFVRALWPCEQRKCETESFLGTDGFALLKVRRLSQGMGQLAALECAMQSGAPVLLLDEPANALDPFNVDRCAVALRGLLASGTTVLMACHRADAVSEICTRELGLADGRVVDRADEASL